MKRTKKALAVVLSLSMLASITPQIVLANSNIPDRYEEVSEMQAIVKDAEVHAYVTRNGGTAELTDSNGVETTFTQGIGYREYTATPADGWVWKGWTYEQLYQGEDLGNRTDYGWVKRYSFSNDGSDWNSAYNGTGQTISVNRLLTKGETVGNKIIYNIYANFNPTINATAGTGGTITDNGVTEVNYGDSKQYDITADAGQDIASVSVDGQDISNAVGKDNFSYTFENVREPHTIDVTFTNELYTVSYQFINGADDKELPKEVNDMLPKATSYVYGVKVVPVALKADRVETTDGVWLFEGWTPEEIEKLTADTAFTGTWTFAKNAGGINHIPVITAEDKTLTVGDSFDVMAGVTALDKEDGDLTDKIEVINNTVDTSKAGTYTVTYKVTDSNGASVTKTITITVKDKNNTASKADKPDTAVKTGDSTNVLLWSMATIISLTGVITALIFKRRRSR